VHGEAVKRKKEKQKALMWQIDIHTDHPRRRLKTKFCIWIVIGGSPSSKCHASLKLAKRFRRCGAEIRPFSLLQH